MGVSPGCVAAVRSASGDTMSEADAAALIRHMEAQRKAFEARGNIADLDARMAQLAAEQAEAAAIGAALQRRHAALSAIAFDATLRDARARAGAGRKRWQALMDILEGTASNYDGARASVSRQRMAFEASYLGDGIMAPIARERPHILGLLRDRAFLDDVVREMSAPGSTKNADAAFTGRLLGQALERARADLNRHGGAIGKLDGYAGPQRHDADKLMKAGRARWIDETLPRLDADRTFPDTPEDADRRRILGDIWDSIVFGREPEIRGADEAVVRSPANLAGRLGQHRVLHFAGADQWLAYSQAYGHGHVFDAVVTTLQRQAQAAAQLSILGPNPVNTLYRVTQALEEDVRGDATLTPRQRRRELAALRRARDGGTMSRLAMAMREMTGATRAGGDQTAADIGATIRAVQSLAKLGGAVVSSISDLVTRATALTWQGKPIFQAYSDQLADLMQGRGKGQQREIAFQVGEGFDGIIGHIVSPYVAGDTMPGAMHAAMNVFFRLNGLTWWTDANRAGQARMLSNWMGRNAGKRFDDLDRSYRRALRQQGITPEGWDAIRATVFTGDNGQLYVTPERIAALGDDAIMPLARERLEAVEQGLAARTERRLRANGREAAWIEARIGRQSARRQRILDRLDKLQAWADARQDKARAGLRERIGAIEETLSELDAWASGYWNQAWSAADEAAARGDDLPLMRDAGPGPVQDGPNLPDEAAALLPEPVAPLRQVVDDPAAPALPRIPRQPERLASFLRRIGGVKDEGGDVRAMVGGPRGRPGLINNARGVPLDEAARRAWEAGYIGKPDERPMINDLLDALDEDLRGNPVFGRDDAAEAWRQARAMAADMEETAARIGFDLRPDTTRGEWQAALDEARVREQQWKTHFDDAAEPAGGVYDRDTALTLDARDAAERQADLQQRASQAGGDRSAAEGADGRLSDPDQGAGRRGEVQPGAAEGLPRGADDDGRQPRPPLRDTGRVSRPPLRALGRREGGLRRRLVELDAAMRALDREAEAAARDRADDAIRRDLEGLAELRDFIARAKDRIEARNDALGDDAARQDGRIARVMDETRRDLELTLRGFFADEVSFGVIEADEATRRIITAGQAPGTIIGEAARFIMQFKGYPIAFTQRVLGRAFMGGEGQHWWQRALDSSGHIGHLVAGTAIAGFMAMTAKDFLAGRTMRDPTAPATWLAALTQGGGAGIYGDFLFGEANRFGNRALETIAGPTIGTAASIANLAARARDGDAKAGEALRLVVGNTPFANLFYARPIIDMLFLNALTESLSPGFLARQEAQRRREFGQEYWLPRTMF